MKISIGGMMASHEPIKVAKTSAMLVENKCQMCVFRVALIYVMPLPSPSSALKCVAKSNKAIIREFAYWDLIVFFLICYNHLCFLLLMIKSKSKKHKLFLS